MSSTNEGFRRRYAYSLLAKQERYVDKLAGEIAKELLESESIKELTEDFEKKNMSTSNPFDFEDIDIDKLLVDVGATPNMPSDTDDSDDDGKVGFDTVILPKEKIEEVKSAISQLENHELIFNVWGFKKTFEKGTAVSLLFYGIPGTGKTMLAQAIADYLNAEVISVGNAQIQTSEPGGAERAIIKVFQQATRANEAFKQNKYENKQSIVFFDECDSLLADRANMGTILAAQVNCLLGEIEKFTGIVIFTTNMLGRLDPALERRLTAKIEFEFPTKEQREAIWRRMIPAKAPLDPDVDFNKLSDIKIVGGNIKNAVLNAARAAAYKKLEAINMACFTEAANKEAEALRAFQEEHVNEMRGNSVRRKMQDAVMENKTGANTISNVDVDRVIDITDDIDEKIDDKEKSDILDEVNDLLK